MVTLAGDEGGVSPLFLGIVGVTVVTGVALRAGWTDAGIAVFVFVLGGWLVSLVIHELAHAATAYWAGDRSVKSKGYLTLDPRRYADPGLSILLPLVFVAAGGIGLPGGAVWVNQGALRTRWHRTAVSIAGPLTNAVFAFGCFVAVDRGWAGSEPAFVAALAFLGVLEAAVTVLNLLPVPGLDGFGALEPHLPRAMVARLAPVRRWGLLAVIGALWLVEPLNDAFWDVAYGAGERLGVDRLLASYGAFLFEFWQR